jgi:plastocyanin
MRAEGRALALATCAALLLPATGLGEPPEAAAQKVVRLGDFFFRPSHLSVAAGTTIVWRWPATPGEPHDVLLTNGPRGVKRFRSKLERSDYSFRRTLRKRGRYSFVCTVHPEDMRLRIRVR